MRHDRGHRRRDVLIDGFALYQRQRQLRGFALFPAIAAGRSPRVAFARLFALAAAGRLRVEVGHRAHWNEIAAAAALLSARGFAGKAVLEVSA